MCLGSIALVTEVWEADGVRLGRLEDGTVLPLVFVPDAAPGSYVLVHLGIAAEVLDPRTAADALALRATPDQEGAR